MALAIYIFLLILGVLIQRPAHRAGPRPKARRDSAVYFPVLFSHIGSLLFPIGEWLFVRPPFDFALAMSGSALFVIALSIRGTAIRALGLNYAHEGKVLESYSLVTGGIYRKVRHPIYFSNVMLAVAGPLILNVKYSFLLSALYIVFTLAGLVKEERFLSESVEGYLDYMSRTKRFVPGLF
ncbi:MAG: methyltransferase family protein [Candidatus Aquicultorales bacterium]